MRGWIAAGVIGVVFGLTLSWTGLSSPEVIREGLLFQNSYLFLFFGSAVATAFVGLRLVRRARVRAVLTGEPVEWENPKPQRRHFVGSLIFGTGWAIADACPGPIATQLGQGVLWSLCTIAGLVIGIQLYMRRQAQAETSDAEPPREAPAPRRPAAAPGRA